MLDYVIEIPAIIKSYTDKDGSRKIRLEASNSQKDSEGDVILQKALLDSVESFLSGNLDLDHLSEIGHRYGIANPQQYIVGRPLAVYDMGEGRTGVEAELYKGNPHADKIWEGLNQNPPQPWRASIYGFPLDGGLIDISKGYTGETYGATRYLVTKLFWKSLALTLHPVNDKIQETAHIVKSEVFMKSRIDEVLKSLGIAKTSEFSLPTIAVSPGGLYGPKELPQDEGEREENTADSKPQVRKTTPMYHAPRNRVELLGHYNHIAAGKSEYAGEGKGGNSVASFRDHFMHTCGLDYHSADIYGLALMYILKHR
ncbi:MAG: hypothetical protein KGI54_15405 [Pseudomonadota bacterium]|nr:hypothetical protein [Pseudomonadota bacterium]